MKKFYLNFKIIKFQSKKIKKFLVEMDKKLNIPKMF